MTALLRVNGFRKPNALALSPASGFWFTWFVPFVKALSQFFSTRTHKQIEDERCRDPSSNRLGFRVCHSDIGIRVSRHSRRSSITHFRIGGRREFERRELFCLVVIGEPAVELEPLEKEAYRMTSNLPGTTVFQAKDSALLE